MTVHKVCGHTARAIQNDLWALNGLRSVDEDLTASELPQFSLDDENGEPKDQAEQKRILARIERIHTYAKAVAAIALFTQDHMNRMRARIDVYATDRALWLTAPGAAQVSGKLTIIKERADALLDGLSSLAGASPLRQAAHSNLRAHFSAVAVEIGAGPGFSIDDLELRMLCLSLAADRAIKSMPAARSRPPKDPYLFPFVRDLHDIFESAGGKSKQSNFGGEFSGLFHDLAVAAAALVGQTSASAVRLAINAIKASQSKPADLLK